MCGGRLHLERPVCMVCLEHSECWLQLERSAYFECSKKHLVQLECVVHLERSMPLYLECTEEHSAYLERGRS